VSAAAQKLRDTDRMGITRDEVEALDAADPLGRYRDRFVIDDESLVYLDGNSLGRLPKASRERVVEVLDQDWGSSLIQSWTDRWIDLPNRIGDLIGTTLLGTGRDEVIVGDSTTVALYKVLTACLDARPDRRTVVIEKSNFPTDRYVVESLAGQRALDIRWLDDTGVDGVSLDQVTAALDESVAVAVLSHVDYRSAALLDMAGITAAVHDVEALMVWDLCHSVGCVPIDLRADGVDAAVGCTYKYLSGGPGAPAFTFVRRELQGELKQPIWGWWSRQEMFTMAHGYEASAGMKAWLAGTPGVLSMVAVEPGVALIAEAGIDRIRAKSVELTGLAVRLYDDMLAPVGFGLATPRNADSRGSHVTVSHPDAETLTDKLIADGVVPDFRRPDGIRLGLAPLTTRFVDVYDGVARLEWLASLG
jgi:kynureninase